MGEMPALNESTENALAREREEQRLGAALSVVLGRGARPSDAEYGWDKYLRDHPERLARIVFAGRPDVTASQLKAYLDLKSFRPEDAADMVDFWIDDVEAYVYGSRNRKPDKNVAHAFDELCLELARKLARLWEVNGA